MRKILILLAVFYTVVLSLNYILGVAKTPPGYLFLGTVHYPSDYLYYLSQFTQGKDYWFGTIDLYTSEKIQPMFVWFTNVLTGHVLSLVHIPPILAYQLTVTLYTFLFFLLVIFFLEAVFPKEKEAQCIAFILLGIANVMPGSGSFFSNFTEPMTRFPRIPHHMLGLVCIILPIIIVSEWQKSHSLPIKSIQVIFTIVASVLLANVSPIQWVLVCCTLLLAVLLDRLIHKRILNQLPRVFILPAVFLLSGLPMIFYSVHVFKELPLIQSAVWDFKVQIRLPFNDFFKSFGPVFVLAVFGLPLFCKRMTLARTLIFVYTAASIALFISPISQHTGITNVRFISAVTILGESIIAAHFILHIPIFDRTVRRAVTWMIVLVLSIILIPQFILQFQRHADLNIFDSHIYLSNYAVSAYREVQKITTEKDVVLATWPFDMSFPALTGRRGFMGHPLLTIDSDKKNHQAYLFFDAKIDDTAMHTFLIDNGITYVLGFTSVTKIMKPFLTVIYQNSLVTVYKVLPLDK